MIAPACDPQTAADLLRALAHPMRLQILCCLMDGEHAVAAFESELGLKQPNLSQQLAMLREAGLVTTRREAKSIFYSLADNRVRILLAALRDAFDTDLAATSPQATPPHAAPPHAAPPRAAASARASAAFATPATAPTAAPPAPASMPMLAAPRRPVARRSPRSATDQPNAQPNGECGVFSVAGWPETEEETP